MGKIILLIFLLSTTFPIYVRENPKPNPYFAWIEKYSNHYKLDIRIVYSVCVVENEIYKTSLINSKDAVGLMQIRPITYRDWYWRTKEKKM